MEATKYGVELILAVLANKHNDVAAVEDLYGEESGEYHGKPVSAIVVSSVSDCDDGDEQYERQKEDKDSIDVFTDDLYKISRAPV